MSKYLIGLAVAALLTAVVGEADAGIFFRRGGCPGGRCNVGYAAPAASTAKIADATPEVAKTNSAATTERSETTTSASDTGQQAATTSTSYQRRYARFRLFGRLFR